MQDPIILLVEDDAALLEGMSDTLEMVGYRTIKARDGREGLEVLEQVRPDLIVSDIMMPEMDGYAFHEAVASIPETATIPFIFLTAKSDQADVHRGLRVGVDAYLTKPFDLEELLLHVQNKLSRFATIRNQALAHLDQLQHDIVNMFSHELRTPLTYIQGYTDLLAGMPQTGTSPDEMQTFLEGIQSGSRRLNKLVDSLLALVQLDTRTYEQEFERFAIVELDWAGTVRLAAAAHQPQALEKGVVMQVRVDEPLPAVRMVPERILRACDEIIANAVGFSHRTGARVEIHAYGQDDRACIEVADQGAGIAPGDLPHVFERFRQFNRNRQEQAGIGVGLAIARGLVRVHGGDIEVDSDLGGVAGLPFGCLWCGTPMPR